MSLFWKRRGDKCLECLKGEEGVDKTPFGISRPVHKQKDIGHNLYTLRFLLDPLNPWKVDCCWTKFKRTNFHMMKNPQHSGHTLRRCNTRMTGKLGFLSTVMSRFTLKSANCSFNRMDVMLESWVCLLCVNCNSHTGLLIYLVFLSPLQLQVCTKVSCIFVIWQQLKYLQFCYSSTVLLEEKHCSTTWMLFLQLYIGKFQNFIYVNTHIHTFICTHW